MSKVTVSHLAEDVGITVDRLLKQLGEAGINKISADDEISDIEKRDLLANLRKSHGKKLSRDASGAKGKVTLKRRSSSTLTQPSTATRTASSRGREVGRNVNVEVRRKRTFHKEMESKSSEQLHQEADAAKKALEEQAQQRAALQNENDARRQAEADRRGKEVGLKQEKEQKKEQKKQQLEEEALRERDEQARREEQLKEDKKKVAAAKVARQEAQKKPEQKPAAPARRRQKPAAEAGRKQLHVASDRRGRGKKRRTKGRASRIDIPETEHGFQKPTAPVVRDVEVPETISVGDLAQRMSVKGVDVIKALMQMGMMVTINETLDQDTALLVVEEMGHKAVFGKSADAESLLLEKLMAASAGGKEVPRAPIVTIMGHVDHGKTSLLDYIRKSSVTSGEAGGITQHIGAYHVETGHGMISFLDTPGHAAFSAMRARGAQATDIVIIVVAADDGVMPQTKEAIQHARSAEVPLIVAVNKMDKPEAQPDRVMQEMVAEEVVPEDWGGDVQFVKVSAHSGEGIDDLLDAILLQAELLELSSVSDGPAHGVIVEATLDKGRGPVATVLVQSGTLKKGDTLVCGTEFGRVRAMYDENGIEVESVGPSIPVAVLGLSSAPNAGDDAIVTPDEKQARELAEVRRAKLRDSRLAEQKAAKLNELFEQMGKEEVINVNLVVKADVHGSVEAIKESLENISTDEIKIRVVASGVGGINESDANLAASTNAIVIGFNVRADAASRRILEERGLELRYYSIIYEVIDDVRKAASGLLSPEIREKIVGLAEVRDVFRSSRIGAIAGCMVLEGVVKRNNPIRVLRDNIVIFEGELESLRRFKDDVAEVRSGTECGIGVKSYNDIEEGDQIEVFERTEFAREL
ncbi:MAG: translation initiation factor IF-2 [Gammaproteobacteria bacterium]|nr:translation initiation factor IF-2 [Gammaproteobacteria bacterium]